MRKSRFTEEQIVGILREADGGATVRELLRRHGISQVIRPGKPVDNAYIEAFNGRFRDECLNEHWFLSLADARVRIESWRVSYNTARPHSALRQLTPQRFREQLEHTEQLNRLSA